MKKPQLRKIIKESIKQLITEQNQNNQACIDGGAPGYNQAASSLIGQAGGAGFPFTGKPGITPQFVANMAGKSFQFYNTRKNILAAKKQSLTNGHIPLCDGDNPMWQAKLTIKMMYIQHSMQNMGDC